MKTIQPQTTISLKVPEVDEAVTFISQKLGFDVSVYDETFLKKSLEKRLTRTSCVTLSAYLDYLSDNEEEAKAFSSSLNITYSEFFRGALAFAILEKMILPALMGEKRSGASEIRIWSAGCAGGQEAYSVAMILNELAGEKDPEIPFRIFATDISEESLEIARRGIYDSKSVQNVTLRYLLKYFDQRAELYVIDPKLRERIEFSQYDLLHDSSCCPPASIFGNFDLVICSNVLFYYSHDLRKFILNKIGRSLTQSGYLLTTEAERGIVQQAEAFRAISVPATFFQRFDRRI